MGSRIIESAASCDQILFAQLYLNTFFITLISAQSDPIKRWVLYFKNHDSAKGMTLIINSFCHFAVDWKSVYDKSTDVEFAIFLDFPKF